MLKDPEDLLEDEEEEEFETEETPKDPELSSDSTEVLIPKDLSSIHRVLL
jgi:hypothetical protein